MVIVSGDLAEWDGIESVVSLLVFVRWYGECEYVRRNGNSCADGRFLMKEEEE